MLEMNVLVFKTVEFKLEHQHLLEYFLVIAVVVLAPGDGSCWGLLGLGKGMTSACWCLCKLSH